MFDLLGLISPIVIQAKLIFQVLCKQPIDWGINAPHDVVKVKVNNLLIGAFMHHTMWLR